MIITKQSYEIRLETSQTYDARIAAATADKEDAKSQGDLSENFGYVEALKDIEKYRRMQADLGIHTPGIQIVDPEKWVDLDMDGVPRAMIGSKLEIERNGVKETILIGGAWDGDVNNEKIVPYTSPLGQALIPKQPGTAITLGEWTIKIVSAAAPDAAWLKELYGAPKKKREKPPVLAGYEM